jgi:hypothetical protein
VSPVLQAQDGSYVGTLYDDQGQEYMVAFDGSGNVRWSVAGVFPRVALANAGVVGETGLQGDLPVSFDASGTPVATVPLRIRSWRGNSYALGSVFRLSDLGVQTAYTLWAQEGANPSKNGTASRNWKFVLVWSNDFTFSDTQGRWPAIDISWAAAQIKSVALKNLKDTYISMPVNIVEGTQHVVGAHDGDSFTTVVNEDIDLESPPGCGATSSLNPQYLRQVGYVRNVIEAQDATGISFGSASQAAAALRSRPDLINAIGRGIGHIAAHEIAHQFLVRCCGMDADPSTDLAARGTINATGCNGKTDPSPWTGYWPSPRIDLHWEPVTLDALTQCLSGGFRAFNGRSCHQ